MIALTPEIIALAKAGAWYVFSVSGGKDSGAALHAAFAWLDSIGHPRDRRLALHADLGRAEWPITLDVVKQVADHVGIASEVVRQTNDLVWRFQDRWRRSLARYTRLETINLVSPWSSSSLLYCRSEQKAVPLSRFKAKLSGDLPVVGVVGIRREESTKRSKAAIVAPDNDMIRRNGRRGFLWLPIVDWTSEQVFAYHHEHGIPLHPAYAMGSSRLSCALCVLASRNDLTTSIHRGGNRDVFKSYSDLELISSFSFQPANWISDFGLEGDVDAAALSASKAIAAERKAVQTAIPQGLLKAKSIKGIDRAGAEALAGVRRRMGELYAIQPIGTTAGEILELSQALH